MKKPSKDFSTRYAAAKRWRDSARPYIEEIFRFCAPGREGDFSRRGSTTLTEAETFHSLPEELAIDLAGDLVDYYTPAEASWTNFLVTAPVPEDQVSDVTDLVETREQDIRDLIASSNYYDIAPQWGFETATHGTPALWVQQAHLMQPIHVEVVPPHELLIVPGHLGLLDRFREQWVNADTLAALFKDWDVDLSDPRIRNKINKPGATAKVCWGFWVDWTDPARPMWKAEITVDEIGVMEAEVIGDLAGACPLLVGRFNPQIGKPWGRGSGWKALPDMRTLDKIDEVVLTGLDDALKNTLIYPDDGFIDLSEGVIAGSAIPASRGFTRDMIYELQKGTNLDYGFYTEEGFIERLNRAFYQDGPRQRGDTPPTASQWIDQRRQVQKRLGKPSAPLWTEMICPMVQRFEYLGVQTGQLEEAITFNEQVITLQPISPMQKAQNQDQVMISRSNLGLAFEVFQDRVDNFIDPVGTFRNIVRASGDELTVMREKERVVENPKNTSSPQ
ncbi:portal protein [Oceanicola sp. S124]|uniref:portal protein n=1 Tax=Oceanicola sp. S124 TaxID=1042378 RepID=UPI000255A95D|nr:portal protein [Oceanicola sp. S124]